MKKVLNSLLILMIGCVLLTGFTVSLAKTEPVIISWYTESQDEATVANTRKYIIEPFEKKYPGIKIKHVPTADWNQVLKVQMAAGEGPDLFNLDGPTVAAEYASANRLLDMTPYVKKYGWDKIIFPWALDTCKIKGKVYSIPNSYEGLVLWYNADMLKENNWPVPKNFKDLEKIATESKKKGTFAFAFGASDFQPADEWFISMVLANYAGRDAVKKALLGEIKWTDEPIKGAFKLLVKMWQDGWINDRNSQSISVDDSRALFASGKTPLKMEGTWLYGIYHTQKPSITWNMALFPSLRAGVPQSLPLALGGVFGVNANTKYPEEVAKFINFEYTQVKLHAQGVEKAGFQTYPRDIPTKLFSSKMDPVQKKMIKTLVGAQKSNSIGYCTWTFWPSDTRNYMIQNMQKVYLGAMTLDEFLHGVQQTFNKDKAAGKVPMIP